MLDNKGCKHTLRICNTYCLSMATMVTRTQLSVTFYTYFACVVWPLNCRVANKGGGIYFQDHYLGVLQKKKRGKIGASEFIITVVEFSFPLPLPLPNVISQVTSMFPCQSKKCVAVGAQCALSAIRMIRPIFLRT